MTPDVLARKLERLRRYLADLSGHRGRTAHDVSNDPYALERFLELIVQVSVDILSHQLAEMDASPDSYRETFVPAGAHGLVPDDLSERLSRAAGLRNVLVHMYEDIDYEIVAASIDAALENFGALVETFEKGLGEPQ